MKKVLIIGDVDFWNEGAGHRSRVRQLTGFLAKNCELVAIHIGKVTRQDVDILRSQLSFPVLFLNYSDQLKPREYGRIVSKILYRQHFDACIIEYIHNSYFLQFLPPGITTILDIHDLLNDKHQEFDRYNCITTGFTCSTENEFKLYDLFSYIMVICQPDFVRLCEFIDKKKVILASHAPKLAKKRNITGKAGVIGFVASGYQPNIDAIHHFLNVIWPSVQFHTDCVLHIYGNVCESFSLDFKSGRVILKGFIHNLEEIYEGIDIVINPVRFGAGLKIKNMEALAFGLPLITSSHGARGIESAAGRAFLIADSAKEYINHLSKLESDSDFRMKLGEAAFEYICVQFNENASYHQLLNTIESINTAPPLAEVNSMKM